MKSLLFTFLTILLLNPAFANDTHSAETEKFNPGEMILHHIGDSHEWHFATLNHKHITLPLPVILYSQDRGLEVFSSAKFHEGAYNGYILNEHDHIESTEGRHFTDISITKNVASMLLSVTVMLLVFTSIASAYKSRKGKAPKGAQSFFEPIILFIRDDIAKPNIGEKYAKFMPYLLTVFFFIWFNNILGLFPGGANLTGNIAVTLTLSVITFLLTTFNGNKSYWGHVFNTPGVPWWLKWGLPIMPIVEFIGLFTKPFSLMIRLFANITAGHIIILSLLSLIFIFESFAVGIGSSIFALAMNFLELFVAILQAYVFTLLSAMYLGGAVAEHDHDHHEEHGELQHAELEQALNTPTSHKH